MWDRRAIYLYWTDRLMPNRWYRNKKVIYHSHVESHMIYGIVIWASSLSKNALNQFSNDDIPNDLKNVKKSAKYNYSCNHSST